MMSLKLTQGAAAALGNQVQAGIPLAQAVRRMAKLQKDYEEYWSATAKKLEDGDKLSMHLDEIWPQALVNAVRAGEESGKLNDMFARIELAVEQQRNINGLIFKLAYPVFFGLAGICVFIFFMIHVLPALSKTLGVGNHGFVFDLSLAMQAYFQKYWIITIVGLCGLVAAAVFWIRDPTNRAALADIFVSFPLLGIALNNLYFGLWSYYMALVAASGSISLRDGVLMTAPVLPGPLQTGLILFADEVELKGVSNSVDPEKLDADDPRAKWPFYINNAFLVSDDTGLVEDMLIRAAPSLIKEGTAQLNAAINVANVIALAVSGFLIVAPLMAYYIQLGLALQQALRG